MKLNQIKSIPAKHPVIHHPFLEAFREGKLSVAQVKAWVEQQFYFSISLPSVFAALYARIPNQFWAEKRALVDLIKVEAWGSEDSHHSQHFKELCNFLKIDLQQLTKQAPKPYTKDYLDYRLQLCLDPQRSLSDGLASIAIGNELLNLFLFKAYRQGIQKISGLEHCPTGYFEVHLADEHKDYMVFSQLFELISQAEMDLVSAKLALEQLLDQRVKFFDALYQDISALG